MINIVAEVCKKIHFSFERKPFYENKKKLYILYPKIFLRASINVSIKKKKSESFYIPKFFIKKDSTCVMY